MLRELVYMLVYREWTVNFLLVWALAIPPAVMVLLIGRFEGQTQPIDQ